MAQSVTEGAAAGVWGRSPRKFWDFYAHKVNGCLFHLGILIKNNYITLSENVNKLRIFIAIKSKVKAFQKIILEGVSLIALIVDDITVQPLFIQ